MSANRRPIIVLGAARSGTKFLRDVLAADSQTAVVPYDVNFIWRTGNEDCPHDALDPALCTEKVASRIRAELRRAAGLERGRDDRRLLEKTVSNTLRLEFVSRVLPDADFVHIIRNGMDVVESSIRQWTAPLDWRYFAKKASAFPLRNYRYAIWYAANRLKGIHSSRKPVWGVRYQGIERDLGKLSIAEICARQWAASVRSVREAAARCGNIRICEIRYEDLVEREAILSDLTDWLDIADKKAVNDRYRATVRRTRGNSRLMMSPEEASTVSRIIETIDSAVTSPGLIRLSGTSSA